MTNRIWLKTTLGELATKITSGSRGWAKYYSRNGALFLRMTNLSKNGINLMLHDKKYVSLKSLSREGQRTRVEKNDILISITAELGKIGFVEDELGEAYVNQHVALVRITSKQANPKFVAYYLAEANQRNLWQRLNDSGAKAGLNLQTINKYPIYLPSLAEQNTTADLLSTWDQAIEKAERLIAAKEKRYSWLLRRMITKECTQPGWKQSKLKDILGKELIIEKGKALRKDDII